VKVSSHVWPAAREVGVVRSWPRWVRGALLLSLAWSAGCCSPGRVEPPPDGAPDTVVAPEEHASVVGAATLPPAGPVDPSEIPGLEPFVEGPPSPLIATPGLDDTPPPIEALGPYFLTAPLDEALDAYHAGDNGAAARGFAAFVLTASPDDPRVRPARFMALLSQHDAGEHTPVADELVAMAAAWPELADYALYYAASAHLDARRWDAAAEVAERVPFDSTLWGRAQELRARALRGGGQDAQAAAALARAAARRPAALRASAWALRAALAKDAGDKAGTRKALIEQAARFPTASEGRAALSALGRRPKLDDAERLRLGDALYRAQRHDQALAMLEGLSDKAPGCPAAEGAAAPSGKRPRCAWCRGRYLAARTLEKKKKFDAAWLAFRDALTCTDDDGVYADATFAAGRNRAKAGERAEAEALLEAHIRRFPTRSTVDDSLVLLADLARGAGEDDAADALLMRIVEQRPVGDQVDEAAWELVWPRIADGAYDEALVLADQVLTVAPRETHYRAEGRVRYWRGRLLQLLGREDEAVEDYTRVLAEHPLSWYALLAYSRLVARDAVAARETLAALVADSVVPPDPLARIPARLWREPHFRRGLELVRMGLTSSAQREFEATPDAPDGPEEAEATVAPEEGAEDAAATPDEVPAEASEALSWLWTRVALYHSAGAWHLGMRLARPEEPVFGAAWPAGAHAHVWRLAHPRAFADLVERWAGARGIPAAWVYAIAREESGFNPRIESWANAVGLMQIILPTAEMLARGTDIRPTRESLQEPAVALELGTKYLAKLLGEHGVIPLASAGYNAGSGSVRRWRRAFGDRELDEFVERITFHEARGYAKRVTRSVARYLWLYDGRMLVLPLAPPGAPD